MDRRKFFDRSLVGITGTTAVAAAPAVGADRAPCTRRCEPLANDYTVLWRASDPIHEISYCPTLARLASGRLIGCMLHADTDY